MRPPGKGKKKKTRRQSRRSRGVARNRGEERRPGPLRDPKKRKRDVTAFLHCFEHSKSAKLTPGPRTRKILGPGLGEYPSRGAGIPGVEGESSLAGLRGKSGQLRMFVVRQLGEKKRTAGGRGAEGEIRGENARRTLKSFGSRSVCQKRGSREERGQKTFGPDSGRRKGGKKSGTCPSLATTLPSGDMVRARGVRKERGKGGKGSLSSLYRFSKWRLGGGRKGVRSPS